MPEANPPVAPRRDHVLTAHGDARHDPWYWMRDREDPAVLAYLEAENAYTEAMLAPLAALREELFSEIRARVQEDDVSAPVHHGPWDYFSRTATGSQYAVHGRRPAGRADGVDEVVLLDENELAGASAYFALGGFAPSPSQQLLAYSTDHNGSERYTLRIRDLERGTDLPDVIAPVYYGLAWADDETLFFVRPDDAMRPFQVWRHVVGDDPANDALVFTEEDERYVVSLHRSRSGACIVIGSHSKVTSEVHWIPTSTPSADPRLVAPREEGVEYAVEHHGDPQRGRFFIVTNADGALDSKLVTAPMASTDRDAWRDVLPARPGVKVEAVDAFAAHLVVSERAEGLERLQVLTVDDAGTAAPGHTIAMLDPVYSVWIGETPDYETRVIRYGYSSLVQPTSSYDYDLATRAAVLVKRQPVLGGYDPEQYVSRRSWATAPDGTQVPVSIVHRRDVALDGTAPGLLYGYGSYEVCIDPTFSSARLSLLERGFVFAIAHIRGGGEMGRAWYEDGKLMHKRNTFTDFIAAAEHLIATGSVDPRRLGMRGGSAGGLLVGAVMTMRPDLPAAVVAEVPFVDVVTTMSDPSIPLTVTEWEEWGDPLHDAEAYRYMLSYSPYDNVEARDYPALLVTAGLHDPRVQYWEPAKLVARLRATKTDEHLLLLKTELGAGHGGPSGRYDAWRDEALVYAFLVRELS